jgi:hypothetical protein
MGPNRGLIVAGVNFNDVAKVYRDGIRAVPDFDLEISRGASRVL